MLFVFYCFVLTVLASLIIPEGQGNCRNLKFTSFHKLGFRLENHTVRTIDVVNEDLCMFQCYLEPNCVSYNFYKIKHSSGKHKCDLNNATIEHDEDLVENKSCIYRGAENACKQNPCKNNATCQAGFTDRDYQCLCVDGSGFKGHKCDEDIDECLSGKHGCEGNTTCDNTIGSYCCRCKKGYQGNKTNCTDIDECLNGTHSCDVNAECNNTLGSYKCTCKNGFQGNGTKCTEKVWSVIICEEEKRTISCENDRRIINVVAANYGRLDSNTCHHSAVSDTNCKAANSLVIVRKKCDEEASCELHAQSSVFGGDPCPNTFKYLEVKYKCVNLDLRCQRTLGMESDGITDEQISFSSRKRNDTKIVRLHHTGTTWIADKKDINPWLQVDLRAQNTKVTRVATQGSHQKKKRVKKYKLQYSNYGVRFQNYKEQGETISKEFDGNTDKNNVVYHDLNPPITARYIRFLPVEWEGEISIRVELYGCVKECGRFLGMQSGEISDGQLSASSERDSKHSATQSRLYVVNPDGVGSWAAAKNDTDQWLQVDLVILHTQVTRVATQGSNGHQREWVTKYNLQYGNDTERFYNYSVPGQNKTKIFAGNMDQNTVVYHDLNPPITARYIRFKPVEWQDWMSMRVELYGCVQGFTAVFTNLGKTGSEGPKSIGCHYKDQDHDGQVTVSSGIQLWTVPRTGKYRIEAIGASGGYSEDSFIETGGRGARLIGNFNLTKDEIIHVLVGQKGEKGNSNPKTAGGGGGTFVVRENNISLIIAGGGGGIKKISEQHPGCDASINTTGNAGNNWPLGTGGSNGHGGKTSGGGGGGGFYSNGQSSRSGSGRGGKGYLQGGEGGNGKGGFGGGGGLRGGNRGAGGGGGYSGGNGGANEQFSCGGGGGSFNNGTNQQNECCFNRYGHGRVIITFLQ
nr:uncharacterized protein LOC131785858 [Pocillopora verrucosa]